MIKGLFETHLFVKDIERSAAFYKNVLGLEECYRDEQRNILFFWVGSPQKSMLGLWQVPANEVQQRHFAFECDSEWVLNYSVSFLKQNKLPFYNFLNDGIEKPMVFAWMPAVSIYFHDPDGHILEFIGILNGLPRPHLGVLSYEEWLGVTSNT